MKAQWTRLLTVFALLAAPLASGAVLTLSVPNSQVAASTAVTVKMQADGSENTVQFTLGWDPAVLQYVSHSLGASASGATFFPNVDQTNGRIGVMIGLAPNQAFPAGQATLLVVNFTAAISTATTLEFRDDIPGFPKKKVISPAADTIASSFSNLSLAGASSTGAPTISLQPAAVTVAAGAAATFSINVSGNPAPTYQWRKNGTAITGATDSAYLIASVASTDAGTYDVVVSNSAGTATSSPALLTVTVAVGAPAITTQPAAQIDAPPGGTVSVMVVATGTPAPTFQWYRNGTAVAAATNATLTLANVQAAAAGNYTVAVTNSAGSVTSAAAAVSVTRAGNSASHAVVGYGYVPGQTVTVATTLTYSGVANALGWTVFLPPGWSFLSASGSVGSTGPAVGQVEVLEWAWTSIPASPVTFSYTVNVPTGQTGTKEMMSWAGVRNGENLQFHVNPNPLAVAQLTTHSADTDHDGKLNLIELTRVIELYNTRNNNVRTGCYAVALTTTEDGFTPESTRASTALVTLGRHHSADTNTDGKLSLLELTRVIELYNYRAGNARTGQYKRQSGTEDGFLPGP